MLGDEFGTASNIKSRVNRQSVLGAITSAQQRLKLYNRVSSVHGIWIAFKIALQVVVIISSRDAGAAQRPRGVHWDDFDRGGQGEEGQY